MGDQFSLNKIVFKRKYGFIKIRDVRHNVL